jgi:hypothetical protein
MYTRPIPVTARFKVWVCDRSLAGSLGSDPAGCMVVCLLWVLLYCHVQLSASVWSLVQWCVSYCMCCRNFDNDEELPSRDCCPIKLSYFARRLVQTDDKRIRNEKQQKYLVFIDAYQLYNCLMYFYKLWYCSFEMWWQGRMEKIS